MIFSNKLFKVIILRGKPWNLRIPCDSGIHIISSPDLCGKSQLVSIRYLMKLSMIVKACFVVPWFSNPELYIHSLDIYDTDIFYDPESVFIPGCLERKECHITVP